MELIVKPKTKVTVPRSTVFHNRDEMLKFSQLERDIMERLDLFYRDCIKRRAISDNDLVIRLKKKAYNFAFSKALELYRIFGKKNGYGVEFEVEDKNEGNAQDSFWFTQLDWNNEPQRRIQFCLI